MNFTAEKTEGAMAKTTIGKILFTKEDIDMFSMVIIGNSKTYIKDNWMITPRGYHV